MSKYVQPGTFLFALIDVFTNEAIPDLDFVQLCFLPVGKLISFKQPSFAIPDNFSSSEETNEVTNTYPAKENFLTPLKTLLKSCLYSICFGLGSINRLTLLILKKSHMCMSDRQYHIL